MYGTGLGFYGIDCSTGFRNINRSTTSNFVSEIYQTITQHNWVTFSTILFSWMHSSYSIWYAIAVIPAGLLLANTFIIFQKRKSPVLDDKFSYLKMHSGDNTID
jgi:hypothetical protein